MDNLYVSAPSKFPYERYKCSPFKGQTNHHQCLQYFHLEYFKNVEVKMTLNIYDINSIMPYHK